MLYRTWEWQRRRVLHVHLVLPYGTTGEQAATDEYVSRLHQAARRHGFGYVLGGDRDDEPSWYYPPRVKQMDLNAVAAYVSKYVSKAGDSRDGMVNVARSAGMRGSVLYIAPQLMRASGVTMTTLRARRRIYGKYPWARGSRRAWSEACVVDAVQQGHAPLTQEAVEAIRHQCRTSIPGMIRTEVRGALRAPTRAPEPPGLGGYGPRATLPGRRLFVGLASVLLRVPEPPELGWLRCCVGEIVG